ncbi:hypothetical protein, partial [Streptomyces sp. NPDC018045]|uniref:hypothetical protein n=1 Tax=Streptomyces sp. NPDC018045 TaxID=3365037 RepID=UPI0037AC4931
ILAVLISAGAFRPFGFFAVPTLPDPFGVSAFPYPVPAGAGRPSGFRFPAFPTLSDPIHSPFPG